MTKINLILKFVFVLVFTQMMTRGVSAIYYGDAGSPRPNEIQIAEVGIVMPLGRILIIKRGSDYCAIKFNKFWTGKTDEDYFAQYESYSKKDKTGEFSKANVQIKKEELSFPKPRGIGRFAFSHGNKEVKCGAFRLFWSGQGAVHFYGLGQKQGDYGIELAPTKWTDISQVNVFDPRLKWYRYDEKRERVNIPADKLWEGKKK